jgi:hypothetical protein
MQRLGKISPELVGASAKVNAQVVDGKPSF